MLNLINDQQDLFERSPETALLVTRLKKVKENEIIKYGELSAAIGFDIRKKRYFIYSALDILKREDAYVFACVHSVGYRRLPNEQISKKAQEKHLRKLTLDNEKYRNTLHCVDLSRLNSSQTSEYICAKSLLVVREAIADESTIAQLNQQIEKNTIRSVKESSKYILENLHEFY